MWAENLHFGQREVYPVWSLSSQQVDQVSGAQGFEEVNKADRNLSMLSLG